MTDVVTHRSNPLATIFLTVVGLAVAAGLGFLAVWLWGLIPPSFWPSPVGWLLITAGGILLVTVGILISLAFLLLADRKIWAGVQMR